MKNDSDKASVSRRRKRLAQHTGRYESARGSDVGSGYGDDSGVTVDFIFQRTIVRI